MTRIAWTVVAAPWGPINVAASEQAVVAVEQLVPPEPFLAGLARRHGDVSPSAAARRLADEAASQVEAYLAGSRRTFDLPIDLGPLAGWDLAVLRAVATIPWGTATSYGRVARRIDRPGAARAVGGSVGRNPIGLLVPCHRVVAGDGSIGGYGGGWWGSREVLLDVKRELLRLEGIELPVRSWAD